MSKVTKIQWCDSTVNPIMGCAGCELYPSPEQVLKAIDHDLIKTDVKGWENGKAKELFLHVLAEAWQGLLSTVGEPGVGHFNEVTTTNIRHLRHQLGANLAESFGTKAGKIAVAAIESSLSCYAAQLHANRTFNIDKPLRNVKRGYAPTFESVTPFPGRLADAAKWKDLTGVDRSEKPWLDGMPRLTFVSDMGDAFSRKQDFSFLEREMLAFQNQGGQRHLWLWLTKRPEKMRQFAESIGGFPPNVCAMTTVTSAKYFGRIAALRAVDASVRGLSLEPLWESVADKIDLTDIDWVIVGGESGAKAKVSPFHMEWVHELRDRCHEQGVAFFVKQLGSRPFRNGKELKFADRHGGDWNEWPIEFCQREMPDYFRKYANLLERSRAFVV